MKPAIIIICTSLLFSACTKTGKKAKIVCKKVSTEVLQDGIGLLRDISLNY